MRYETINRICECGSTSTYIFKGSITKRDILEHTDTYCLKCLQKRCIAQCTCMSEWELLTDVIYNKRNNEGN